MLSKSKKMLQEEFEKRHFISTWFKDNYEPLIDIQTFFSGDTFLFPTGFGVNGDLLL